MVEPFLRVENLKKHYPVGGGFFRRAARSVKAVDGVGFSMQKGETLGLVGESGCGKSTLGRCVLRLEEPTAGEVYFEGEAILSFQKERLRALRRDMQIVFQDPYSSLNPRKSVGQILSEPFEAHGLMNKGQRQDRIQELLDIVGLHPDQVHRYPHEFSGGQRQRICIARALALNPKLVIADEPVSALDVSIQAQILNLLVQLQGRLGLTYLFISHDLSVIRHFTDRVAVMYLGRIVELGRSGEVYGRPHHPYAEALISAAPTTNPLKKRDTILLEGEVPSPIDPPPGCTFHPRCPSAREVCSREAPSDREISAGRTVACHFPRNA